MNLKLASRVGVLRASDIREILKITQRSEVISFAGGLPAPELVKSIIMCKMPGSYFAVIEVGPL